MSLSKKSTLLLAELKAHLPFTFIGVSTAVVLLGVVHVFLLPLMSDRESAAFQTVYHISHFGHIFLSAVATTSLFCRHSRNIAKAVFVGYSATLIFCSLSDFVIPYLGGIILGIPMHAHLCLIEEPLLAVVWNTLGILLGIFSVKRFGRASHSSHSAHVFFSSFASLFYLVTFGFEITFITVILMFLITLIAVVIPCCSSDIIMPISFLGGLHGHEHEDEHTPHHH